MREIVFTTLGAALSESHTALPVYALPLACERRRPNVRPVVGADVASDAAIHGGCVHVGVSDLHRRELGVKLTGARCIIRGLLRLGPVEGRGHGGGNDGDRGSDPTHDWYGDPNGCHADAD